MQTSPRDDVLLVIDVQNDFCPGGALAVAAGDAVVPVINRLSERFDHVVLTQDWHPPGHSSFAASHPGSAPFNPHHALWPADAVTDHCVQGTSGAGFHPRLKTDRAELVIRQGFRPEIDSYSAFYENDRRTPTGLSGYLASAPCGGFFWPGSPPISVSIIPRSTPRLGFDVVLLEAGCRAIDLAGSLEAAHQAMAAAGVQRVGDLA